MSDRIDTDRLRGDYHVDDPAPGVLPGDIARLCDEVDRLEEENAALRAEVDDWRGADVEAEMTRRLHLAMDQEQRALAAEAERDALRVQIRDWRYGFVALDALMAHPDHATREALDQWRTITRTTLARYPEEGNDD